MSFPVVQATSSGNNSATTSHSVTLPSGIEAGDKLIVFFTCEGSAGGATNTPSGWTKLAERVEDSGAEDIRLVIYTKTAAGSDTLTVTTPTGTDSAYTCYRVYTDNDVVVGALVDGDSTNPNPPSYTPPSGSQKYMWIAAAAFRGSISAYPANYTNNQLSNTAENYDIATAVRFNETATEDPGTFTTTLGEWVAATVAVEAQSIVVGSFPIISNPSTIFQPAIDFAADATFSILEMSSQILQPTATASKRTNWQNETKPSTTWTNETL